MRSVSQHVLLRSLLPSRGDRHNFKEIGARTRTGRRKSGSQGYGSIGVDTVGCSIGFLPAQCLLVPCFRSYLPVWNTGKPSDCRKNTNLCLLDISYRRNLVLTCHSHSETEKTHPGLAHSKRCRK